MKIFKKCFMKFLSLIIFLLFSSNVFGGVGDVYYCTGQNLLRIENFKVTQYKPFNFKFKRSENKIEFGSEDNYIQNQILNNKIFDLGTETFDYSDSDTRVMTYLNGKFHYSFVTYDVITVITGTCDVF